MSKSKVISSSTIEFQNGSVIVGRVDISQSDKSDELRSITGAQGLQYSMDLLNVYLMDQSLYNSGLESSDRSLKTPIL